SEAFTLFDTMLGSLRTDVTRVLMNLQVQAPPPAPPPPPPMVETKIDPATGRNVAAGDNLASTAGTSRSVIGANAGSDTKIGDAPGNWDRTPRNAPCPCGSGKKYKKCHGAIETA
ncbi:MAG: SEC-C metal-binding domain-containing protein, partial [Pseudomonadota bacterium]